MSTPQVGTKTVAKFKDLIAAWNTIRNDGVAKLTILASVLQGESRHDIAGTRIAEIQALVPLLCEVLEDMNRVLVDQRDLCDVLSPLVEEYKAEFAVKESIAVDINHLIPSERLQVYILSWEAEPMIQSEADAVLSALSVSQRTLDTIAQRRVDSESFMTWSPGSYKSSLNTSIQPTTP